jgi:glycosyltransferase involved in cell wall biosynthesis
MRPVPKILFINRYFCPDLSATSQMVSDLAFALAACGDSVCVVTSRQRYEYPQDRLPSRERLQGVDVRRVWTTRFGRSNLLGRMLDYASFYFAAFVELLRVARRGDIIVAKTDPPLISVVAWVVSRMRRARLVNWLQDLFPEVAVGLGVVTRRVWVAPIVWLRNCSLRAAEVNTVLSEAMRRRLIMNHVVPARVEVIPNWADGTRVRPVAHESNALRREWGLADQFIVGYSGNLGRAHEFQTMLGAMQRLRGDTGTVFVFIGGGVGMAGLQEAVASAGLANCRFLPYQPAERLAESLSAPNVHLVSLRPQLEGLIVPSKIYGIAAAGRPAIFIGAADGEVANLISACGFGFTVAVGETDELVECLLALKRDSRLSAGMGERARACFERYYERAHGVRRWRTLLDSVSKRGREQSEKLDEAAP